VHAGCKHPRTRPRPRTKNSNFPHTRTRLNRLFPVKFGAGAEFVAMSIFKTMPPVVKSSAQFHLLRMDMATNPPPPDPAAHGPNLTGESRFNWVWCGGNLNF